MPTEINWESLQKHGTRCFYKENTIIYKERSYGKGFYYIQKGFIKLLTSTVKGNKRLLTISFPGQILGIQALDKNHYATTAVAAKDSVLYFFASEQIAFLIQEYPGLLDLITDTVNENNKVLIQNVYLDTMTSEQKISCVLLTYHRELKKNNIYLTVSDLVNYTGLTRVTVRKILKDMELEGVICMKGKAFAVIRPEYLEDIFEDCEM